MYKNVLLAFWFFSHISNNNTPLTAEACSFLLPAIFITAGKIDFFLFLFVWFFYLLNLAIFSGDDVQQHRKQCSQISSSFSKAFVVI